MLHAEALFFVDDDEAEVFEDDVFGEEAVGADNDVDAASGEAADVGGLFGFGAEAVEGFDGNGVFAEALADGLGVLLGKDGGGGKEGGLFAAHDALENRADGDLGLAETDVAADEAVGGAGGFEVELGLFDGAELVFGGGVDEGALELVLPMGVGAEGVADAGVPLGLEAKHGGGVFEDRTLGFFHGALPFAVAEDGERGVALAEADVAADLPGLVEGDVEFAVVGELEGEGGLGRRAGGIVRLQADVAADAVVEVDDEIAGLEFRVVHATARGGGAVAANPLAAGALASGAAEDLGVAENGELGGGADEAGDEAAFAEVERLRVDVVVAGEFGEALPLAFVVTDKGDGPLVGGPLAELVEETAALGFVDDEVAGFEDVDAGGVEGRGRLARVEGRLGDHDRAVRGSACWVEVEREVGFFLVGS